MANWISIYGPAVTSLVASDVLLAQSSSGVQKLLTADLLVHKQNDNRFKAASPVDITSTGVTSSLTVGSGFTASRRIHARSADSYTSIRLDGANGGQVVLGTASGEQGSIYTDTDNGLHFFVNSGDRLFISSGGVVRPGADNAQTLGAASFRWSVVYAGTGTINTSDEREKHWLGALTPAHLAAAKRIAAEIGLFQWLAAIAEKGEGGARIHCGVKAQRVWEIMIDEGLETAPEEGADPDIRHGFLCYDRWEEIEPREEVRGEDDNIVQPAIEGRAAGDRWGVRPDQLALFLAVGQEARLAALEAAA